MDIKEDREAFEVLYKPCDRIAFCFGLKKYVQLSREDNDSEIVDHANQCWELWQAAKAQVVTEWISVEDQLPPNDPYNREYWVYETLNNKVQHDYWVCPDKELDQRFEPFFNNWFGSVTHWMPMVKYPKPPVQFQEADND